MTQFVTFNNRECGHEFRLQSSYTLLQWYKIFSWWKNRWILMNFQFRQMENQIIYNRAFAWEAISEELSINAPFRSKIQFIKMNQLFRWKWITFLKLFQMRCSCPFWNWATTTSSQSQLFWNLAQRHATPISTLIVGVKFQRNNKLTKLNLMII